MNADADRVTPTQPDAAVTLTFSDRHVATLLATFAAVLFSFASRLRLNDPPYGDEPHYLIMSIALGKYHTFDLTQAYASRDYFAFFPQELDLHVFPAADGTMVPLHNFGGPLLWTLPFSVWGRAGAAAVVVAVSVLLVVNVYHLLRELGIVRAYAGLATVMFVIGTPVYMYASMQFVEPIGALPVIFAVRTVLNPAPSAARVAIASAGLGYLPWVHGRLIIFSVLLGGLLIARAAQAARRDGAGRRPAMAAYAPAVAPMALLILALELFNVTHYGALSPAPGNAVYGDGLLQIAPSKGLAYLTFDRQYGLLSHFPLLALAVPGVLLASRRSVVPTHLVLLATMVPYVLAISTFRTWWAGYSPPGRLLMVVTPLLMYYVAVLLQRLHSWTVTSLALLTALAGFAVTMTGDLNTLARFTTSGGAGVDPVLDHLAGLTHLNGLPQLLPSGVTPATNHVDFFPWFLALAAFTAIMCRLACGRPAGRIPVADLDSLFPRLRTLRQGRLVRRRPANEPLREEAPPGELVEHRSAR